MSMFNEYPYRNLTDLNLDYLLKQIGKITQEVTEFVTLNTIKYANPISWNITTQYGKNTVVIDPMTGTAYLSSKPVPIGVALSDTNYWSVIFDLGRFITLASQNFANSYESVLTTTATMETVKGGWIVWDSVLYETLNDIHVGDRYVIGGNIKKTTVEDFYDRLAARIAQEISDRIAADDVLQDHIDAEAQARQDADGTLQNHIDAEAQARQDGDGTLQNHIDAEAQARQDADGTLQDHINEEAQARQDADGLLHDADTNLQNQIGDLNNLNTRAKDNTVSAINELAGSIREGDRLHYVYVENYINDGMNDIAALRQAIADCPPKGTVVIPRTKPLVLSDTIVIDKPIAIKGLSNGMEEIEGGNDNTPNSDYIKYDIRFTGGSIGFNILSPAVTIEDLVIQFNVNGDFKVFNLGSQTGDQLNMPRDINMRRLWILNEDTTYNYRTFAVSSDQVCILSTFEDIHVGWTTVGFAFSANINTSLRFVRCNVTASESSYYIAHGQYCYFEACGSESPNTLYAFSFVESKAITLIGCFAEQCASPAVYCRTCEGVVVEAFFSTTLPIVHGYISGISVISCASSATSTTGSPAFIFEACQVTLASNFDCYVKNNNNVYRQGRSNKLISNEGTLAAGGFSITGATSTYDWFTQLDYHVTITITLAPTSTQITVTCPPALIAMATSIRSGNGWTARIDEGTRVITIALDSTVARTVTFDYEAVAAL